MSLGRVPEGVVDLFQGLTGMRWPEMDPDKMYELAAVYHDTGEKILDDLPELFNKGVNTLTETFHMSATDPFVKSMAQFTVGDPNYLAQLALTAARIGDFVTQTAADAEYTKMMIIAQLIELLAEIAFAIFMAGFGFFEWLANLSIEYLITREFIINMLEWFVRNIAQHVIIGVSTGVAMDRIIQRIQINEHHRDGFDNALLLQAVEFGVIGGLLAGPFAKLGAGLGKGLGKILGQDLTRLLANTIGRGLSGSFGKGLSVASARSLGEDLAKALTRDLRGLYRGISDAAGRISDAFGAAFEKHVGDVLGADLAREFGRVYGGALAANWGRGDLAAVLRDVVRELADSAGGEAGALLRAEADVLAKELPDAIRELLRRRPEGTLRYRAGTQVGGMAGDWAHGNFTEGFYNLIFDPSHSFRMTLNTGLAMAAMSRGAHLAHWGAFKIADAYFPNRPSIPGLLDKYLGLHAGDTAPALIPPYQPHPGEPSHDGPALGGVPTDSGGRPGEPSGGDVASRPAEPASAPRPYNVAPPPSRAAADDARGAGWERRQQEIAGGYDAKFAEKTRVQRTMEQLRPEAAKSFTDWAARRTSDGSVPALADALGIPHTALSAEHLAQVRDRALAQATDTVTRFAQATPEQVRDGLPAEYDRQALHVAAQVAAEHLADQYFGRQQRLIGGDEASSVTMSPAGVSAVREATTTAFKFYVDDKVRSVLAPQHGHGLAEGAAAVRDTIAEAAAGLPAKADLETARLAAGAEAAQTFDAAVAEHLPEPPRPLGENSDPITALLGEFRARAIDHLKLSYVTAVDGVFHAAYGHLDPYARPASHLPPGGEARPAPADGGTRPAPHGRSAGAVPARGWDEQLRELSDRLPGQLREVAAWDAPLRARWEQLSSASTQWRQRAKPPEAELFGRFDLDGTQPGAAALRSVQQNFFALLGAGLRSVYPDGPGVAPDPAKAAEWDATVGHVVEVLPHMISWETARAAVRQEAQSRFDAYLSGRAPVPLGQEAIDRARDGYVERVDQAFAEQIGIGAEHDVAGFDARLDQLTRELDTHLEFESDAAEGLSRAGVLFDEIAERRESGAAIRDELASEFREEWFAAFHEAWAPKDSDAFDWLRHEGAHENAFRAAPPPTVSRDAEPVTGERAAPGGAPPVPRRGATDRTDEPVTEGGPITRPGPPARVRPATTSTTVSAPARAPARAPAQALAPSRATDPTPDPTRSAPAPGTDAVLGSNGAARPRTDPEIYDVDSVWVHPLTGVRTRAAFDARFTSEDGQPVTELTVRVKLVPDATVTPAELSASWAALREGVAEYFNAPGYQFRRYGTMKITVEPVSTGPAHYEIGLSHRYEQITQTRWRPGISSQQAAHEFGHQLGLRDESPYEGGPAEQLRVSGSLMGEFDTAAPAGLTRGGLRQRYLDLVEHLIDARRAGGPSPRPSPPTVAGLPEPRMPTLRSVNRQVARMEQRPLADALLHPNRQTTPLTPAEARLWVEHTTQLPDNPNPSTAEKWAYLRRLERRNHAIPPVAEPVDGAQPVHQSVLASRDRRPWFEDGTPPPAQPEAAVEFADGHRLPGELPQVLGRDRPSLRLPDEIVERIGTGQELPAAARHRLLVQLREHPEQFFGAGYRLRFTRAGGAEATVLIQARNYGAWSRYSGPPTLRPQLTTIVSSLARRALVLRREPPEPAVRHIDDVYLRAAEIGAAGRRPTSLTIHNGLNWYVSQEATRPPEPVNPVNPVDSHGLPQAIDFARDRTVGDIEVEGAGVEPGRASELSASVFPDDPAAPAREALHDFLDYSLAEHLPELLSGWVEVPGPNPPGVRIRAVPQHATLAYPSEQPPIRPQAPGTGHDLSELASSVFTSLTRSGGALMRDESGWYGVYDTRVHLEIQRLDGQHQPAGTGGRSSYGLEAVARLRMGKGEAQRLSAPPVAPARVVQPTAPTHPTAPQPSTHPITGPSTSAPSDPPPPRPAPIDDPANAQDVLVHGGDGLMVGLSEPVTVPPQARSTGVPKAGLPHLRQVVEMVDGLAKAAGVTVDPLRLRGLPGELLDNYPQLVGGAMIDLGAAEALITIDPTHPWRVVNPAASFDAPSQQSGAINGGAINGGASTGGAPRPAGAEAQPGDPAPETVGVTAPEPKPDGGFHSNETINGRFRTGTHNTTHSGTLGATSANASLNFGFGIGPGVAQVAKVGVSVAGTANRVGRSTTIAEDAEIGMVEDTRDTSTLVAYVPNWRVQLRTDPGITWDRVAYHAVDGPPREKLLLWINDHYLRQSPDSVTASGAPEPPPTEPQPPAKHTAPQPTAPADPPADASPEQIEQHAAAVREYQAELADWQATRRRYFAQLIDYHARRQEYFEHTQLAENHEKNQSALPDILYASALTKLPELFDGIAGQLRAAGYLLPIGSPARTALWQKLSNLDTNLKKAVNDPGGYHFSLHDAGRKIADIRIHTTRGDTLPPPVQVGDTSDKAHIENVRTAIEGVSGSQSLAQESRITGSGEVDLVPVKVLKTAISAYTGMSWSSSYTFGSGRTGLWVLVSRYAGFTNGYHVPMAHIAEISLSREPAAEPRITDPVVGAGLLRMTEPDAFAHGFPVARDAFAGHDPGGAPAPGRIRGTAPESGDPKAAALPLHVEKGKGIGQGLVAVDRGVVATISNDLKVELRRTGFLPPNPDRPFQNGQRGRLASKSDNEDLVDKLVSQAGFDSHYDEMYQDGMTFTLTLRKAGGRMEFARVTVTGRLARTEHTAYEDDQGNRHSEHFVRRTDEFHAVNLAMGMDSAQPGVGGGKRAFVGLRGSIGYGGDDPRGTWFRGYTTGVEYGHSVSASDSLFLMVNRPELLEYPGKLDIFRLPGEYTVQVEYSNGDLTVPGPITARGVDQLHLLPWINNPQRRPTGVVEQRTPKEVIDQAVIFYADSSGLTPALRRVVPGLVGPGRINDDLISKFAGNIMVRSHLKEILYGEYTTDQPFDPGLWRDITGSLAVRGTMRESSFAGATDDKFVVGLIKLWLSQATQSAGRSHGLSWTAMQNNWGGAFPEQGGFDLSGGSTVGMSWGWSKSDSIARTGAKEFLELDFNHVYAFATRVDYQVGGAAEKHGKLAWASISKDQGSLLDKPMIYLLAEHDALTRYAQNNLPIPDSQLADALRRWTDGELRLSGNTVARMLVRRWGEQAGGGIGPWRGTGDLSLDALADRLAELHTTGQLHVTGDAAADFGGAFPDRGIGPGHNPFADRWVPPYLTAPGVRALGHSGIHELTFAADPARGLTGHETPFTLVHGLVERAAPGLLARRPEVWLVGNGAVVGRLQGGIDGLQALLSGKREQPLVEDMLHKEGFSLLLTNRVGWVLSDVVEVNLKYRLASVHEVDDFVPETGIENYTHGYSSTSITRGKDFTYSASARLGLQGPFGHHDKGAPDDFPRGTLSGGPEAHVGAGTHTSVTRARTETTETTTYDWTGEYLLPVDHTLAVTVRRLNLNGRPLNNLLTAAYRWLSGHDRPVSEVYQGTTVLKIPKSTGDAVPFVGPQQPEYRPLVSWPGDGYMTAVLIDDAQAVARTLLDRMVAGGSADRPDYLSNISLPVELSRTHLQGHLHEAVGGRRYLLSDKIFVPGYSSQRARVWLVGDLFHLHVVAPIETGTGTGAYRKTQDGTTNSLKSDAPRSGWTLGADGGGAYHIIDPANQGAGWATDTLDGAAGTGFDHAYGQGGSQSENYRREQHVKQQGPTYMVRMRGKFRLMGEPYEVNLLSADTTSGRQWSDPFSGDVFALLSAGELHELRHRMAALPTLDETGEDPGGWPAPTAKTPHRDLVDLLVKVGANGYDAWSAPGEIAQLLRAEIGGGPARPMPTNILLRRPDEGLVLHSDDRYEFIRTEYEPHLSWAAGELARFADPDAQALLTRVQQARSALPRLIAEVRGGAVQPPTATALRDASDLVGEVRREIFRRYNDDWQVPAARLDRPPTGNPVELGRRIAHELETYVDLHHTDSAGRTARYRIDPHARVAEFDAGGVPRLAHPAPAEPTRTGATPAPPESASEQTPKPTTPVPEPPSGLPEDSTHAEPPTEPVSYSPALAEHSIELGAHSAGPAEQLTEVVGQSPAGGAATVGATGAAPALAWDTPATDEPVLHIEYADDLPANPHLYSDFHGNFAVGRRPEGYTHVGQFCALLASQWLVRGTPVQGLPFGLLTLADRNALVRDFVRQTRSLYTGTDVQLAYAHELLAEENSAAVRLADSVGDQDLTPGTRIWLANERHTIGVLVQRDGQVLVYDPDNDGTKLLSSITAFRTYLRLRGDYTTFLIAGPLPASQTVNAGGST